MITVDQLTIQIKEHLGHLIERTSVACDELTIEVTPMHLRDVCTLLRDDPRLDFKLLIDVCGVDYLQYGLSEWATESTTATGFERGVDRAHFPQSKKENQAAIAFAMNAETKAIPMSPVEISSLPSMTIIEESVVEKSQPTISEEASAVGVQTKSLEKAIGTPADPVTQPGPPPPSRFASVYHLLSLTQNCRVRIKVYLDEKNLKVPSVVDIWPSANWFEREAFDLFGIIYDNHPDLRRILTDYGFVGHPFRKDFPLIGNVEARYDAKLQRVVYDPVSIQPRVLEPKVIRRDNRYEVGE